MHDEIPESVADRVDQGASEIGAAAATSLPGSLRGALLALW